MLFNNYKLLVSLLAEAITIIGVQKSPTRFFVIFFLFTKIK